MVRARSDGLIRRFPCRDRGPVFSHKRARSSQQFGGYRQGFSAELAAAMTAHTLSGDPDLATWVPQQVHVAQIDDGQALVWFPTPAALGATWGLEDYTVLRLRRDGDRWVVYEGRDQSAPPAL